jgi:hypothetical protein
MDTTNIKASILGLVYMAGIATIFGFWQNNVLAGIFMFALLLFVEKLIRVLVVVISEHQ